MTSPSPDRNMDENKERRLRLRKNVLDEIISSEESYIKQLDMLLNGFVRPVRDKNTIPKHSFSAIFGDIEPLYSLNIVLHDELQKSENVGSAFLKIAPYLKLYSTYAHDYELATRSLQALRKSNKAFEAFVSQQERLPHISRKLEALLIVPIQRVPRYRLLLTELIAHTDQTEEEYTILNAALKQVEAVAHHINEQIREQENVQRMIRIQRSLAQGNPKIITPGRRLIKEGSLRKVSADSESAHHRYFILFNDMLLYCRVRSPGSEINHKGSLICNCVLPLRHCKAEAVVGDGLFRVTCRDECLLLCSDTAEEGKQWVETISAAVEQLEANFRTLRKESSSRRPIRKRQLHQKDSLMRKFHQKKLTLTDQNTCLPNAFEVQVLRSENIDSHSPRQNPTSKSPRVIKLPKWPESCSGSPSFTYSPRKLLAFMSPSSPNSSPVHEVQTVTLKREGWLYFLASIVGDYF
ncbi:FYVE, RhoGEF and PH domain-containing protein 3 isoform X1 [Daphnia magna]|uniref:FYVE, RhoGEF and PH domain-containing protein 3 isoform X1 n=1 Tax=Daphnia magna TaxID=35525 RepID=UPI001E1BCC9E|nr:FYVE, RhoGEF and PH domain-containing protein 3 isoform X1 [Daphnia magna]